MEDFFFSFPCFLLYSHGVPSKFLMGSQNVHKSTSQCPKVTGTHLARERHAPGLKKINTVLRKPGDF
jgi:hypothetical protein